MTPTTADEAQHPPGPQPWWREAWSFDVWTPDGVGACTCLTVLPHRRATWYWTALVRPGHPVLHLVDLDAGGLRPGLEVRTDGLWASHTCEVAGRQWTVANEAYAVALDDPAAALGRALGVPEPVAFDLEWYAEGPARPVDGQPEVEGEGGYEQDGTVDGRIELAGGHLDLEGAPSHRVHRWGPLVPPPAGVEARPEGRWVPFALDGPDGPEVLDRVLTPTGWWERRRPR